MIISSFLLYLQLSKIKTRKSRIWTFDENLEKNLNTKNLMETKC